MGRKGFVLFLGACVVAMTAMGADDASRQSTGPVASDMGPAVIVPDLPPGPPLRSDLDAYGGWTALKGRKTGFFHVEQLGARWWFVTPEGNAYFMLQMGWIHEEDAARVRSWGFNAGEEKTGMPYAVNVNFFRLDAPQYPVAHVPGLPPWVTFPDVFDPAWAERCKTQAERVLGPIKDDPMLIGYFLVNEMCLSGWYEAATHTRKDAPSRAAFVEVARAYYADKPGVLEKDWHVYRVAKIEDLFDVQGDPPPIAGLKDAWVSALAERAYSVASNAAKAVAPNHLNLGTRMINAPLPEPGILKAMGKYCDVVSMNLYSFLPDRLLTQVFTLIPAMNMLTGRPTMTTEFSYRGGDTLHPNTMGALPTVKTQAERAVGYLSYVSALASVPTHIGVSWYKYSDDDLEKPWDVYAEDCNFGVIDPQRRPYAVLTETMRATNAVIYELASGPVRNPEIPLFWRTELLRWDLPLDEVLIGRYSRSGQRFVDPLAQQLPEPRRYHQQYWVRHRGPTLTVNDDRFVGWCQANMVKTNPDGLTLTLINVQALTTFPRSLWLGTECEDPDEPFTLESNAQFLSRRIDAAGRLLRLTMADGSYLRTEYDQSELRVDRRVPYLDLQFNHDGKRLDVTIRGSAERLGLAGVRGWKVTCNGEPLPEDHISEQQNQTVLLVAR